MEAPPQAPPNYLHWKTDKDVLYVTCITYLETPQGQELLRISKSAGLSQHAEIRPFFQPQAKGSFCGIASSVIAANWLKRQLAVSQDAGYAFVLTNVVEKEEDMRYGLTLPEVGEMMKHFGLRVLHRRGWRAVSDEVVAQFREDLRTTIGSPHRLLVANFIRKVGDHRGGHISPIVAYEPSSDQLLILDTNAKRIQPHWIPVTVFALLMCTVDGGSKQPRGYVIVENRDG